jgi:hypothetical protein
MTAEPARTSGRDIVRTLWVMQRHGETMQAQVLETRSELELRIGKRDGDLPMVWLFGHGHARLEAQAAFIRRTLIATGWTPCDGVCL